MAILTKAKPALYEITKDNPWGLAVGDVVELMNADRDVPENFAAISQRFHGPRPPHPRVTNAEYFRQQATRPATPRAAPELTRQQVCERFHWSAEDLVRAERLNFPKPNGQRIKSGKLVSLWVGRAVEDVEEWRADVLALAKTIRI